eukprot:TRINITY_DN28885_c0_g1_i2.p1 TRINITY_DN28885_c0_g1~~TRINITY_DN28885_c0_g1_i2.p1  ORF type:complete len:347 (+),score=56.32 TRINITY_DN28885_c0_g1_i2:89-1129(+)
MSNPAGPEIVTLGLLIFTYGTTLMLTIGGAALQDSNHRFAVLKYKVSWNSRLVQSQIFEVCMGLLFCSLKLHSILIVGANPADCEALAKVSIVFLTMVDFTVYLFLINRSSTVKFGPEERPDDLKRTRILFAMAMASPVLALFHGIVEEGKVDLANDLCFSETDTVGNFVAHILGALLNTFLNIGFLYSFLKPLWELSHMSQHHATVHRLDEVTRKNVIACILCVTGGIVYHGMMVVSALPAVGIPVFDSIDRGYTQTFIYWGNFLLILSTFVSTSKAWEWNMQLVPRRPTDEAARLHHARTESGMTRTPRGTAGSDATVRRDATNSIPAPEGVLKDTRSNTHDVL